jgi:hypothetical protein
VRLGRGARHRWTHGEDRFAVRLNSRARQRYVFVVHATKAHDKGPGHVRSLAFAVRPVEDARQRGALM